MYDSLAVNLPHPIMAFDCFAFPPSSSVYPPASGVLTYLKSFATNFDLWPHIHLNTEILHVDRDPSNSHWKVSSSTNENLTFDFVVVANGHYRVPRYPSVPGVDKWLKSGKASHSVWYRRKHDIGQVVLVVGGGPSGKDISEEMRSAAQLVYHSVPGSASRDTGNLRIRGRVVEFLDDDKVLFEDGTVEKNIDHCILATGYEINFPFLSESILKRSLPPSVPPFPSSAYNSTYHVFPLMKHLFPLQSQYPPTSIAFPGLLYRVAPLPLMEAQAHVIVKVWRDPGALDPTQEAVALISRSEHFRHIFGDDEVRIAKAFLWFEPMEQYDYRDELSNFAFSGDLEEIEKRRVPDWHREMYVNREILRAEWRELEREGAAEEFVRGVGDGGPHEWEGLMRRLLARAAEHRGKSRL